MEKKLSTGSQAVLVFAFCFLVLCIYLVTTQNGGRSNQKNTSSPHGSAETLNEILTAHGFVEKIAPLLGYLGIDGDGPLEKGFEGSADGRAGRLIEAGLLEGAYFRFTTSGELLRFRRMTAGRSTSEGPAPVSKTDVVRMAKEIFAMDVFGQDTEGLTYTLSEDSAIHIPSPRASEEEDKLSSGRWQMYIGRTFNGIQCMSAVTIGVDVSSGQITMIENFPFFPPESTVVKISKQEAIEIANESAGPSWTSDKVWKEFTQIGSPFSADAPASPTSTLCWVVSFKKLNTNEKPSPYEIFVSCETGKILGSFD